jgi:hypothetical protein
MTMRRTCQREFEVLAAVKTQHAGPALAHLAGCASCQKAVSIAELFETAGISDECDLPEPGQIYWRAQLKQRRAMAERATRPIQWVQKTAISAVVALCTIAAVAMWPVLAASFRVARPSTPALAGHDVLAAVTAGMVLLVVTIAIGWLTAGFDDA